MLGLVEYFQGLLNVLCDIALHVTLGVTMSQNPGSCHLNDFMLMIEVCLGHCNLFSDDDLRPIRLFLHHFTFTDIYTPQGFLRQSLAVNLVRNGFVTRHFTMRHFEMSYLIKRGFDSKWCAIRWFVLGRLAGRMPIFNHPIS